MNFEKMTPEELAQPTNGYQMLAVVTALDSIKKDVSTIVNQTAGVATQSQLDAQEKELKEYTDKEIRTAVEAIHTKYEPMQKEHDWVKYSLIGSVVVQVIIAGIMFTLSRGA